MVAINCLFADDEPADSRQVGRNMLSRWTPKFSLPLEFVHKHTVDETLEELLRRHVAYQVVIADILFKYGNITKPTGLDIIKEAAKYRDSLVIVGLSAGDLNNQPSMADQALERGADLFVYKSQLLDGGGFEKLCDDIHDALVRKHLISSRIHIEPDEHWPPQLTSIIEEVGLRNVEVLYSQTLESLGVDGVLDKAAQPLSARATYVSPGLSGAHLLKLQVAPPGAPSAAHLLKISRSAERLKRELVHFPAFGEYSSRLFVRYTPMKNGRLATAQEWYAISAIFEQGSKTLRSWLAQTNEQGKVHGVLQSLFLDGGLTSAYIPDQSTSSEPRSAIKSLYPNSSRRARIVNALDELRKVISHPNMGVQTSWKEHDKEIRDFVLDQTLPGVRAEHIPDGNCYQCQCHGDLHGGNVLVTTGKHPVPIVIDTSEVGRYHWAIDYVRLVADLVVTVYDRGPEEYRWKEFPRWLELVRRIVAPKDRQLPLVPDSAVDRQNRSVVHALHWLHRKLNHICPAVREGNDLAQRIWELQLAFAVEFLRTAYRQDLTPPKRALGLVAGHFCLRASVLSQKKLHQGTKK